MMTSPCSMGWGISTPLHWKGNSSDISRVDWPRDNGYTSRVPVHCSVTRGVCQLSTVQLER